MKKLSTLLLVLSIVGCSGGTGERVNLPDGPGKTLRLDIYGPDDRTRPAASFNVTEASSVDAIVMVLRQGIRQTDHRCADIGTAANGT